MRIAVLGLGRSGLASVRALCRGGNRVVAFDALPVERLGDVPAELAELGAELHAGWDGSWPGLNVDAIVTSPGLEKTHPALTSARAHGTPVWSEVELAYRLARAPILAITGSNGKSTTTVMTHLCLSGIESGPRPILCGNIYGSGYSEIPLTEAAEAAGPDAVLVAEISSFQLEWIETFKPLAAIITNLSDDHLTRYRDFDDYAATKHRIFRNMDSGGRALWHSLDPITEPYGAYDIDPFPPRQASSSYPQIVRFGRRGDAAWAEGGSLCIEGAMIGPLPFQEPHNLLNAMAAVLLARAATGAAPTPTDLAAGLQRFRGLAHRMQRLGERDGVLVVNNSMCTNPGAVVASTRGLDRVQHLLVGGQNKDMRFDPLREFLETSPHHVYLYGRDAEEINRQLGGRWPVFLTLEEAFAAARKAARPGEAIVLSPGAASMDQFTNFVDRGESFTRMAEEWLNA